MKLNEVAVGSILNLSLSVNGQIIQFSSRIVLDMTDSVLVEPIMKNNKTIGLDGYNVQVVYAPSNGESPLVWLKTRVKLVKYKGNTYHQIIPEGTGRIFNRRDGERIPVNVKGTASGRDFSHEIVIRDVSNNGLSFICDAQLPSNTSIRIQFKDLDYDFNLSVGICWFTNEQNTSRYIYGCSIFSKNVRMENYIAKKKGNE